MLAYLSVAMIGSLAIGAEGVEAIEQELARMEGAWSFASVEVDGNKAPEQPFAANKVIISKDGNFVILQRSRITHARLKPDPTKSPKQYDSTILDGPAKGSTFKCIYELEGDSFKLCGPYRGGERPTEFATSPGSGLVLQVLHREKQSVKDALTEAGRVELAGTWEVVPVAQEGTSAPGNDTSKMLLTFDAAGKLTEAGPAGTTVAATTVVDPSASPMTIDITYTEGELKGRTALGIYRLEQGTLTVCRAAPGKPRPAEFASQPGGDHTLVTYKRHTPATQ
ncbi:MAG: TIGR03067 domain-containing protein [Planctomycetes bacterium]|nr:TIGR03067 domain-containing protein [Planctomycetota bacterium]